MSAIGKHENAGKEINKRCGGALLRYTCIETHAKSLRNTKPELYILHIQSTIRDTSH